MTDTDERDLARTELTRAAELLRQALDLMNRHGDALGRRIATQADGFPYGEVHDGLVFLMHEVWPMHGRRAAVLMFDNDWTAEEAIYRAAHEALDECLNEMDRFASTDGPDPIEYHNARDRALAIIDEYRDPRLNSFAEGYLPI